MNNVVASMAGEDLDKLVKSDEFYGKYRSEIGRRILYEIQRHDPVKVDYLCSPEQFQLLLEHIERVWTDLGASEPHWSVVSTPDFKKENIEKSIQSFNQSGRVEVENLKRLLARVGISIPPTATALEYGCGVGRVTRWLATMVAEVTGVDISPRHLALANDYFEAEKVKNIATIRIKTLQDVKNLPNFDLLYSKIVLQHNPPPIIFKILDILAHKINRSGVGVVQVPTYAKGYSFVVEKYLREMASITRMEMHILPQSVIFDVFESHGCIPREVSRDHLVTTVDFVSTTFVFVKK